MTDLRVQIADVIVRKVLQEDYDDLVEGYLDEILMAADQIILLPAYKAVSQAYYDKLSSPVVPVGNADLIAALEDAQGLLIEAQEALIGRDDVCMAEDGSDAIAVWREKVRTILAALGTKAADTGGEG